MDVGDRGGRSQGGGSKAAQPWREIRSCGIVQGEKKKRKTDGYVCVCVCWCVNNVPILEVTTAAEAKQNNNQLSQ